MKQFYNAILIIKNEHYIDCSGRRRLLRDKLEPKTPQAACCRGGISQACGKEDTTRTSWSRSRLCPEGESVRLKRKSYENEGFYIMFVYNDVEMNDEIDL